MLHLRDLCRCNALTTVVRGMCAPAPFSSRRRRLSPSPISCRATPFSARATPCDTVMHIERGRIWLAVTARDGKEAICGLPGRGAFLGEGGARRSRRAPSERDRYDGDEGTGRCEGAHDSVAPWTSSHFLMRRCLNRSEPAGPPISADRNARSSRCSYGGRIAARRQSTNGKNC